MLLSYNSGSNSINIIDDYDVDCFLKEVLESGDVVKSVFIKSIDKTVEVTRSSSSKPLDIDLNIPLFDEHVTHQWKKNTLTCIPTTPHAPILDLKTITTSKHGVKLAKHKIFDDKEACMYEIGFKCLTEGYEYKVVRSCPNRYAVECVHLECYWYIFTRRIKNDIGFKITYINDNHTCPKTQFYPNHRNATSQMLCQLIMPKFRDVTRVYRPKDIINDLNIEYNFDVSYKRAWKAKQLALESNQGCLIASFAQLPYYCYNLKLANENTVTHIDTDNEGRFKMLFIGFGVALIVQMDDPNITMEEYIRLVEEKAHRRGKVYNWETATFGKIWYNDNVHDLRSVETEFPAIVLNDVLTSEVTLSCEPTVSPLNDNKIDFRISLKTDLENDNEKVNMPSFPSLEPEVSYSNDLDYFKDFENEFLAIVYNDALTSKLDFLTEPAISPQHIDEFDLKDETSLSKCDEEEQNVLNFNDLFPFNIIYPNDLKSGKDNDDDKIDIRGICC
ncbi:hypothetical protein Tco_0167516 [Tanacetum coccineum]